MREKPAECTAHVDYVRGTTEMCSRDPTALHQALPKANGKATAPRRTTIENRDAGVDAASLPNPGGRLKFFKDGKFILELSHRRDGDRTTWFPVPKKTFWPPASTTPNRQESSTSLSVSDDNSSIQSSPWQRDHCWKQANPRRCLTTEFNLYYRRDPRKRLCAHPRLIARKRRRPHDPLIGLTASTQSTTTLTTTTATTNQAQIGQESVAMLCQRDLSFASTCCRRVNNNGSGTGKTLSLIIDKLARLLDPNVVSPRKRILREMERVTLEDQASKRRATPQPTNPTSAPPVPSPKQLSSYSITSILGEDKPNPEPGFLRNLLKLEDGQAVKYSSSHSYPRTRVDPYVASATNPVHHPLYGVPMLPPGPYRAPLWMHYPPPVHYPPPMPIYPPPPPHPSSPPVHHYKDYREQALTPPSDMPLNLSKHAG